MAEFSYIAVTKKGQKVTGTRESDSRDEVAKFLHQQDLTVISIDENLGLDFKRLGSIQIGGVPLKERVLFVKQFSTMLSAGLPIIQALDILVQQTENQFLREKLVKVYRAVESGSALSDAFRKEKSIFSELQISLIVAGEKSGTLNEVMAQVAIDLEKSKQLRSKLIGAMIYPVILMIVMVGVFIMLLLFMIPTVKTLYADFGVEELPTITAILVSMSDAISNPVGILTLLLLVVFGFVGFRYVRSTQYGRYAIDKFLLKIPVFGQLIVKAELAQFNRLLSMLLKNGISIVEALRIISNSMSNVVYKKEVLNSVDEVVKGNPLSLVLAKGNVFPIIMVKMLSTGEETGKIDKISGDMAIYYETELNELTANLTKLIEPFILLGVGGLVGFMAIAVYLPLYQLGQYIQ
ncbi:MAG: type II secretion system F family protein [Candidatus Doudnabacteria bacterium]|nr:type II secretion system F family protein [Candidatus Doudnabacteria bacterium]